jgi:hypothetical protein
MLRLLRLLAVLFTRLFRSRRTLLLENLALRQQLSVFKRKRPQPRLALTDKFFWVVLRQLWPGWKRALIIVLFLAKTSSGQEIEQKDRCLNG